MSENNTNTNATNVTNEANCRASNGYTATVSYSTDAIKTGVEGLIGFVSKLGAIFLEAEENESKRSRDRMFSEQTHEKEMKSLAYEHEERMKALDNEKLDKMIKLEELKNKNNKGRADKSDKI